MHHRCGRCMPGHEANTRGETRSSEQQEMSCGTSTKQGFSGTCRPFHELWRRLQVIVGVRRMSVAQVGAQREHMACNLFLAAMACLQRTNGEGVPKVVNTRAGVSGPTTQTDGADQFQEHGDDGRVGKACSPHRDEEGAVIATNPFSAGQVAIQPLPDRRV